VRLRCAAAGARHLLRPLRQREAEVLIVAVLGMSTKTLAELGVLLGVLAQSINLGKLVHVGLRKRAERLERRLLHRPAPPPPDQRVITVDDIAEIRLKGPS
jgi:hypothetical protein